MNQPAGKTSLAYMPQLDGLRALSVLAVMLSHFMPEGHLLGRLPLSGWGVRCFFVLSGFLITGILLESREAEAVRGHRWGDLLRFYIRRSLRIFPVYYLTVAIILWADVQHARDTWPWLFTYSLNIQMALHNLLLWSIGHFWTLCVEEQFYLVWPFLILFAPARWRMGLVLCAMALTPLFLAFAVAQGPDWYVARSTLLLANTDSLGMGALLALLHRQQDARLPALVRYGWLAGAPLYALLVLLRVTEVWSWGFRVLITLAQSWVLLSVVYAAARGVGGWGGQLLGWAPLRYLGKISYGMYIYHVFMLILVPAVLHKFGFPMPKSALPHFLLLSAATVVVASISWHVVEKPLNDLKRYFPAR